MIDAAKARIRTYPPTDKHCNPVVTEVCNVECINSTPKNISSFKSVEKLIMKLTGISKPSTECQDAMEGVCSASDILNLSPIQHMPESIFNGSRRSGDSEPVTKFETAFGPDNQTVTRVFYAGGVATDFNHGNSSTEISRTPVETHFDDSPPTSNSSVFNRKSALRHSVQNVIHHVPSFRDKKVRREKTFSRRRSSVGCDLNAESSYGCTVGVYSRSGNFETPISWKSHDSYSELVQQTRNNVEKTRSSKSPLPGDLSSSGSICQSQGKFLKRKKSMSTVSLNQRKQSVENNDSGVKNSSSLSDKGRAKEKEAVGTRSLSMSDLAGAEPPIENELQKQCLGKIKESDDSKLTQLLAQLLELEYCKTFL